MLASGAVSEMISIYPSRFKQFGNTSGNSFCLITNSDCLDKFDLVQEGSYNSYYKLPYDEGDDFSLLLSKKIPENSHIIVISPHCLIHSVAPETLSKRKLLIFACNSAPTTLDSIEHFLRCGEKTNPAEQEQLAHEFFQVAEETELLKLRDDQYNTTATFHHLDEAYGWHEQLGVLDWGEQQVFPSGEIACFLVPLKAKTIDEQIRFDINGEIALIGSPVLHSGPPSFQLSDQERIYQQLATIRNHALIATVKNGEITDLNCTDKAARRSHEMLTAMFDVDSRYRIIYEVGFALNHHVKTIAANSAMNEVSAGKKGSVHFGIGMLPYTQYHLDIICPETRVLDQNNKFFFGFEQEKFIKKIKRNRSGACPCMVNEIV